MDDNNTSMAGLTDMSMGEIKRLGDDSVDNSMAFSMAELDTDDNEIGGHKSTALPKGNMLDELNNS